MASGAALGPFARLRQGAVIEENARIGNFVEVKKSRVGRGSKAQHLTYLGDATLGRERQHRRGNDHLQLRWR